VHSSRIHEKLAYKYSRVSGPLRAYARKKRAQFKNMKANDNKKLLKRAETVNTICVAAQKCYANNKLQLTAFFNGLVLSTWFRFHDSVYR